MIEETETKFSELTREMNFEKATFIVTARKEPNVSVDNQTTNIEQIANAQTEELNKLWGAIYQQQKEIRKLNAKMQRRKDEVERKVDHANLLNYFYGWSVPVNQEISLTDRINQLENKSLTNAELEGVQCLLPNAIAPNTASNFPTGVAEDCPDHNTSSEETVEYFEVNQHEDQEENPKQKMQEHLTKSLTTTEITRQHNMSRRTLYKYSQGKKVGDRWNYAGKTYEIVHINKKGEKRHKLVQNVD